MHRRLSSALLFSVASILAAQGSHAQESLTDLDLATLMQMDVTVTTVSKTEQSIYSVAAPIHVVTAEDIRRAGAGSIPEAIRLAPGVVVAQIDPGKWIVGLRGFAWQYANKALILLDGRAVYTPLNSSVYWNSLDVPMEEIQRIEVIRGPGDARWGSHAVNGIINIITRRAEEARGNEVSAGLDTNSGRTVTARHGGQLGANLDYRAYARYLEQGDFETSETRLRLGDRSAVRAGVRLDGELAGGDRISFIGEVQDGRDTSMLSGQTYEILGYETNEWSTLARWERSRGGVEQQLQASFDRLEQRLYETRNTVDLSYQALFKASSAHTLTFGATYKYSSDDTSDEFQMDPVSMTQETYGLFAHDAIALSPRTKLMLGSQFEHNPFTGWEVQPNAQLLFTRAERETYWASVARAVRTPLRTETGFDLAFPIFPGAFARIQGNPEVRSEEVLSYQIGARRGLGETLFLDATAFHNNYAHLIIQRDGIPEFDAELGGMVFPYVYTNSASGHTTGFELAVEAQPLSDWNVRGSVSLYNQTAWEDPVGFGTVTAIKQQFQGHSSLKITPSLQWSADLYYVGAATTGDIPSYWKLDSQLTWLPAHKTKVSLGVRNAFSPEHLEAGVNSVDAVTFVPRMAYLRIVRGF